MNLMLGETFNNRYVVLTVKSFSLDNKLFKHVSCL